MIDWFLVGMDRANFSRAVGDFTGHFLACRECPLGTHKNEGNSSHSGNLSMLGSQGIGSHFAQARC